jgi:hypothetical protein
MVLSVVVIVAALVSPAPARAGGTLVDGDPVDGGALSEAPASIGLGFSEEPDLALSHISVQTAAGDEVNAGPTVRDGEHALRQPIAVRDRGDYTVAFHVEFTDGSDLSGARFFSVGTGVPPMSGSARREAAVASVSAHTHGVDPLSAVMLVANLVTALVVLLLLRRRRVSTAPRAWRLHEPSGEGEPAGPR